jgi:hypothetical protein
VRRSAQAAAAGIPGMEARLAASGVCTLCEIEPDAVAGRGELVAGVAMRFDGGLWGTALLAMEPEDALRWMRSLAVPAPLAAYVSHARGILARALDALARDCGIRIEGGDAALEEDSVVGILLATHAPSDTAVLWARLEAELDGSPAPIHLYALTDAKLLASAVDPSKP